MTSEGAKLVVDTLSGRHCLSNLTKFLNILSLITSNSNTWGPQAKVLLHSPNGDRATRRLVRRGQPASPHESCLHRRTPSADKIEVIGHYPIPRSRTHQGGRGLFPYQTLLG